MRWGGISSVPSLMARGQGQRKASDAPGARQSDPHHPPRTPVPTTGEKGGFFGKLFKK